MSAALNSINSDNLQERFFDLVLHPSIEPEVDKESVPSKGIKHARRPGRRGFAQAVNLDRYIRHRILVGNKKPEKKEEPKNAPLMEIPKKPLPLEIVLTPNPSATILQCRILHEVTHSQQNTNALKKSVQDSKDNGKVASGTNSPLNTLVTVPQIIELGLAGVFELIRETALTHNELCCKALQALLNMLQGQNLEGMKNEPTDVLENLFMTLLDLSRLPEDSLVNDIPEDDEADLDLNASLKGITLHSETAKILNNIPSLASSCLLSLVFAWGNTEKLLSVVASFIADSSRQKGRLYIKVPNTFIELQNTVTAALLQKDHVPNPLQVGIRQESLLSTWNVDFNCQDDEVISLQCDGSYLYALLRSFLLIKIGTGYNNTVQGYVYKERSIIDIEGCSAANENVPEKLFYSEDALYCVSTSGNFFLVHRNDLSVTFLFTTSLESKVWFCVDSPWTVSAVQNGDAYIFKNYSIDDKTLLHKKSLKVSPTKQHMVSMGKALPYNPLKGSVAEKHQCELAQLQLGADFALARTERGQVYFAGKSEALGLKGKSKKTTNLELLPMSTTSKIAHISVAPYGGHAPDSGHAILIAESGEVYFIGTSHRGEDGESSKSRRPTPQKMKLMKCMAGKMVVGGCCNYGTSALITNDGKLFLFGKDSTQADSKTGYVSVLNDVRVAQVALGKAHIVVMSADGRLWTAGVNNRGQCGRQEGVMSITQRIAEVELEKDVSMSEEKSMEDLPLSGDLNKRDAPIAPICSPDKHKWTKEVCLICAVCCECTGYGSNCVNSSKEGRYPGMQCGCGAGWSGCSECGCCRTCAGEADVNADGKRKEEFSFGSPIDVDFPDHLPGGVPPYGFNKLALILQQKNKKSANVASAKENNKPSESEILKEANKMALLPLVQIQLPKELGVTRKAVQISCGDHHTAVITDVASVYAFGKNNHGQLGLGDTNNRNTPTRLDVPFKVTQVSCGSHHTVFLTDEGLVYGCGRNTHGQLGDADASNSDVLTPRLILAFQKPPVNAPKVSLISASKLSTFVRYEEVLLSVEQVEKANIFGNSALIGISYSSEDNNEESKLLLLDPHTSQCQHYTDECVRFARSESVCVDASHNILWSFSAERQQIKSYLLCGYQSQASSNQELPFTPQFAIPLLKDSLITRTQAGLNLLSCINTLVTQYPHGVNTVSKDGKDGQISGHEIGKPVAKSTERSVDDYNIVSRFKSHGGGWGYSAGHSTEAIRFMTDTDILFGGVGVFGGRGEYSVTVAVHEEAGETEGQGEWEALVETDRIPYECGFRERFHVLFDEPVSVTAGQWYTITCKVSGPSSDCGSHGEQSVVTSDNVKFTFRRSKRSNNGTDVSAGQIPELLYTLPVQTHSNEVEASVKPQNVTPVQIVSKDFYMSLTEGVFESLPYLLEWARTSLFVDVGKKSSRYDAADHVVNIAQERIASDAISNLSFVVSACLRLLRVAITQTLGPIRPAYMPLSFIKQCTDLVEAILTDGEIDAALNDALPMPSSDRDLVIASMVSMVTESHAVLMSCVEAFYPTPPQKWIYLNEALESYRTASATEKSHKARMLVAVLDSLCQPSVDLVQCLPLFPRTYSNLGSVVSPSTDAGPSESPSVSDATVGFYDVAYALVEIACAPAHAVVSSDYALASSKGVSCSEDASEFAGLLLLPDQFLVSSACRLLSSLTNDLAYRASDSTQLMGNAKEEKVLSTVNRFESMENSRAWNCGGNSPDAVCFSTESDGVVVCGFGVYGGGKEGHKYELKFLEQPLDVTPFNGKTNWETLDHIKGNYGAKDSGADHIFQIKLNKPITITKKQLYSVQLINHGDRTYCGERGKSSVKCSDGTVFYFLHCEQSSNGTTVAKGQIPTILYRKEQQEEDMPSSPGDKWIGTATTPATAGLAYQRHALNVLALVTESAVEIFSSASCDDSTGGRGDSKHKDVTTGVGESVENIAEEVPEDADTDILLVKNTDAHITLKMRNREKARNVLSTELVTKLLPELFFHIGVLVKGNPHCAVEVMELIRTILLPVINLQQIACPSYKSETKTYSAVVESSHPYKAAAVEEHKASFPPTVKWMLAEFSSKSQTGQAEDFLQLYLSKLKSDDGSSGGPQKHPVMKKMRQDKNWPQDAILLPGNEIHFVLQTASDYTNNRDQKPNLFYGFRCVVTGYEPAQPSQEADGHNLVNELINTAGLASKMLVNVHEQLWSDEESSSVSPENILDKAEHLRAIESMAAVTLERHSSLFLPGLHLDFFPGSSHALSGNLPITEGSKEKMFLQDFVSATNDTSGGRLARWLQPDSYVDPKHCLLLLNVKTLVHTLPTSITIVTRDQYGKSSYVPTLKVELSAKPQPSSHFDMHGGVAYDLSPIEHSPMFETPYEVTKHKDSRYHSVTMMRNYKKYSFEELRIAYPLKRTLKTENILVAHVSSGTYRATWIPSMATTYALQVTLDQQLRGPRQLVTVAEAPLGCTEKPSKQASQYTKLLKFATENSRGLRIRSHPTLQSMQIGLLEFGDIIEYCDQLQNSDGRWVKLTRASIDNYCKEETIEAWCIMYHKHNGRTFLVPVEEKNETFDEVNQKPEPSTGTQGTETSKKLQKILHKIYARGSPPVVQQPFPSKPSQEGAFFTPPIEKSKIFQDSFLPPTTISSEDWKERIPGEYKVMKCGAAGHNIRYNPSLTSAPIGKLITGNAFTAVGVKKNKTGTWLLISRSSMPQFCDEVPDERHGWSLAVTRDGIQHVQLKEEISSPEAAKIASTSNLNRILSQDKLLAKSTPAEEEEEFLGDAETDIPKTFTPFQAAASGRCDSPELGETNSVVIKSSTKQTTKESRKKAPPWQTQMKRHQRSSSDSDALKHVTKKNDGKGESAKRGRSHTPIPGLLGRSHSNPGAKRRLTQQTNTPSTKASSRKSLVDQQTAQKSDLYSGAKAKVPPVKVLRGGKKKNATPPPVKVEPGVDIPFIDDVVDVEGNVLSPTKSPGTSKRPETEDSEHNFDKSSASSEKKNPGINKKPRSFGTAPAVGKEKTSKLKKVFPSRQTTLKQASAAEISSVMRPKKSSQNSSKAISPLVAECSRAVFAAFLWHEGIVHDAMACASYLKFTHIDRSQIMKHVNLVGNVFSKEGEKRRSSASSGEEGSKRQKEMSGQPPDTLVYLAMFWDLLSDFVTKIAVRNQSLPVPTPVNQNLNCNTDKASSSKGDKALANGCNDMEQSMKAAPLKRKAFQRNHHPAPVRMPMMGHRRNFQQPPIPYFPYNPFQGNRDAGDHFKDTACDLCDKMFPYPVTYHMKQAHPGCGKFAGGLGYNSSGHYCGGWAGDCGDGGVGGSTWYLLCVSCRERYMSRKSTATPSKKPTQKTTGSWISRLRHGLSQQVDAHQIMKENAMFLLNLVSASNGSKQLYEQKQDPISLKLDVVQDESEVEDDKIWRQNDLLPRSTFCHCPFPAIPCSYLAVHGKENGLNNNVKQRPVRNARSAQEYRNRSMSNQTTPSSGQLNHIFPQRLSITPDSTPQKTETLLTERRDRLLRSVSTGSQPQRRRACSGSDVSPNGGVTGSFLLQNPSPSMKKLMRGKSGNCNNIAWDAVRGSHVLAFVTQRHDLQSIHTTLQITLRRAALRVYVLQALTWLLRTVVSESSIHDILWYFVSALAGNNSSDAKKNERRSHSNHETVDDEEETKSLYEHPVKDMLNAGFHSMMPLAEAFHGFLQTVSDIMMDLPPNSPVQLMAIRCWSLKVLPSDHQFLHESQVFSHISQILSKVDAKVVKTMQQKLVKVKLNQQKQKYVPVAEMEGDKVSVSYLTDLTNKVQVITSSHAAIANSLTDGSTETFWESGDEDKNKLKHIIVDMNGVQEEIVKLCVHIDNTRDVQKKVSSISFLAEFDEDYVKMGTRELNPQFVGWQLFEIPPNAFGKLKIDLRGPDNGLRVRQVKLIGKTLEKEKDSEQLPASVLRAQICEAEVMKVFKLLTAEVFGQLLSEQQNPLTEVDGVKPDVGKKTASEKTTNENVPKPSSGVPVNTRDPVNPRDVDPNLREHMVGILFSRSKLTSLQKKVFDHTVQSIHTETIHIRSTWEISLSASLSQQPKNDSNDTYCFELLSMLLALSGSDVGCHYVAQQSLLIEDFISLLHTGSPRIQRQVTLLLRRIFSKVTPNQLAAILSARIPRQDRLADASEAETSSAVTDDLSISVLDPLFACVAKALSVQVKGMSGCASVSADEKAGVRSKKACSVRLQDYFSGRPGSDSITWWMHGSVHDQSTVEAIIKLLADMSANKISPSWGTVTKCAVSEAILALTRLSELDRQPEQCLKNVVVWHALSSLCILDSDHAEKLTSAKSNQTKLTCDNHDDGVTSAIVQCNVCGNLCSDCDRYLHLNKRTSSHQRQIFKEEEESIQVNLHEGCGRIKLFWFMALADSNALKAVIEFKSRSPGQRQQTTTTGVCRFCGSVSDSGPLAVGNVCSDNQCQQCATLACTRTHPCGHLCGGVKNELECLQCLHATCNPSLNQDADDMCMICFTDALSAAPAIQLDCGHVFHFKCCETQLKKRYAGPRITFGFMMCSICKTEIKHTSLESYLLPLRELVKEVQRKALQRLEYEGLNECESITAVGGRFYNDPTGFALDKYAYYMCCKCNKAYYGGEVRCDAEAGGDDLFDPQELICGACSDVSCAQICPKHGTDFLEYKCRYCCSVAVYFCFGTTHFCQPCHDDFQRITTMPKSELPHCPAGHKARQLEGKECPLHVQHPATGEEFALGCGVCRNAHTF